MELQTAKTIRFYKTGDASVLTMEDLPIEEPGENELRIKVRTIGLNRAEVMFRNGAYLEAPEFPSKLGYEAAGVVESIGSGVTCFKVGDKVSTIPAFSMGQYGVYGEQVIVPENAVVKCPDGFSFEQSAAIWMQYITAYGALIEIANLQKGQNILITAASSSVGVAAIHIAKNQGAMVIASTRGANKKQFLLDQGADSVVITDTEDLVTRVNKITKGRGVELVFDPIAGPLLMQLAEICSVGGRIIEYGALDDSPAPYPLFAALAKGLKIQGYTLFEITKDKNKLEAAKIYLHSLFSEKKVEPVIDKIFSFSNIQQAHQYMESNKQKGKILVNLDDVN